jgi:hypothetical protein
MQLAMIAGITEEIMRVASAPALRPAGNGSKRGG